MSESASGRCRQRCSQCCTQGSSTDDDSEALAGSVETTEQERLESVNREGVPMTRGLGFVGLP